MHYLLIFGVNMVQYVLYLEIICLINGGKNMAYKISSECISCGACMNDCPIEAISVGDTQYEINADTCIDCGACTGSCPVDAIIAE